MCYLNLPLRECCENRPSGTQIGLDEAEKALDGIAPPPCAYEAWRKLKGAQRLMVYVIISLALFYLRLPI